MTKQELGVSLLRGRPNAGATSANVGMVKDEDLRGADYRQSVRAKSAHAHFFGKRVSGETYSTADFLSGTRIAVMLSAS